MIARSIGRPEAPLPTISRSPWLEGSEQDDYCRECGAGTAEQGPTRSISLSQTVKVARYNLQSGYGGRATETESGARTDGSRRPPARRSPGCHGCDGCIRQIGQ